MRFLKEIVFFALVGFSIALSAQKYGPVRVDLEGYIDDRAGEVTEAEKVDIRTEAPVKKKVVDPIVARGQRKRRAAPIIQNNGPISQSDSGSLTFGGAKSTGSRNMFVYIGIGVGVLLIVIVAIVLKVKSKKSPRTLRENTASLAEKIEENERALMAETQLEEAEVAMPEEPLIDASGEHFVPHSSAEMAAQVAHETKVDERGRNPSGLIIDEDKYFDTGSQGFVDEDFDPSKA
jgi:hypothetical protein